VPERISRSHAEGAKALKPIGSQDLLDKLQNSYTMVEEQHAHGGSHSSAQDEITFF
jgi:hypothetical protein